MKKLKIIDPSSLENKRRGRFIQFGKPDIGFFEKDAVLDVLDSGWLSTGEKVKEFENEFSRVMGDYPCVAVSSCTDGLIGSLMALGIGPNDEVITTPLTFAATINAIIAVGARPVFIDVTPTGHIDPSFIDAVVTDKTRAIVPIHYTGSLCDMPTIRDIANRFNLNVVEDAAHSFGVRYGHLIGDTACYSFYPNKNITSGEGGMVVCKTKEIAENVRRVTTQGLNTDSHMRYSAKYVAHYKVESPGIKANMSDIHAAIGLAQLKRWPQFEGKRKAIWEIYEEAFGKKPAPHSRHIYTIAVENRNAIRYRLYEAGIGTGIHFNPLHLEPAYEFLGYKPDDFPQAETIGEMTLSLPISTVMTDDDANYVVSTVKKEF